jgi:microsomal dipeptidase-like Zn-dependent dipeptidase
VDALKTKGFSDEELGLIVGGNWVDLLTRVAQPAAESAEIDAEI